MFTAYYFNPVGPVMIIIPLAPFKYSTGFAGAETVDDSWVVVDVRNSDNSLLDVPCGSGGAGVDWLGTGTGFQSKSSTLCFFGSWWRVIGYGAPVSCFIIRSVPGALGCSPWITDYATIVRENALSPSSPRTGEIGKELPSQFWSFGATPLLNYRMQVARVLTWLGSSQRGAACSYT